MNELNINQDIFAKTVKRLQKNLKETQIELSLSQSQEILAKSLGFRNYNALVNYFTKEFKTPSESALIKSATVLEDMNEDQLVLTFSTLINNSNNEMWKHKAISFINALVPILIYLKENEGLIINSSIFDYYIEFNNLHKLYKTRRDIPKEHRELLIKYMQNLPGFLDAAPIASQSTIDNHNYVTIYLEPHIHFLRKLEKESIIIVPAKLVNQIKSKKSIEDIINKWSNGDISQLLTRDMQYLIYDNKHNIKGDLLLTDILRLSLGYINEHARLEVFNILRNFGKNLSMIKTYSHQLQSIVKDHDFNKENVL